MNFLGLSVLGAAIISILLGLAGSSYEKKDKSLELQNQQLEMTEENAYQESNEMPQE